jgi:DNA-binding NarL/FixJ family response regulator
LVVAEGSDPAERFAVLGEPTGRSRPEPIRVLLADDSVLFHEGVARLMADAGFQVVEQAADADELMAKVRKVQPDIAITDIRMPPTQTAEGPMPLARSGRSCRVWALVLSRTWRLDTP